MGLFLLILGGFLVVLFFVDLLESPREVQKPGGRAKLDNAAKVARKKQSVDLEFNIQDYATKAREKAALRKAKSERSMREFINNDPERQALLDKARARLDRLFATDIAAELAQIDREYEERDAASNGGPLEFKEEPLESLDVQALVPAISKAQPGDITKGAVRDHAKAIRIPHLVHFTRATNLPSILAHGLYPVGRIHELGITPSINDSLRLDGRKDATSISIAFPNHRMFYKYRQLSQDTEWAVLILDPSVLWEKDCAFCRHNAADSRISRAELGALKTDRAFHGMFDEIEGVGSRAEQGLEAFDPTDEQAEVLVFDVIEPRYIRAVHFNQPSAHSKYLRLLQGRECHIEQANKGVFSSRSYARRQHPTSSVPNLSESMEPNKPSTPPSGPSSQLQQKPRRRMTMTEFEDYLEKNPHEGIASMDVKVNGKPVELPSSPLPPDQSREYRLVTEETERKLPEPSTQPSEPSSQELPKSSKLPPLEMTMSELEKYLEENPDEEFTPTDVTFEGKSVELPSNYQPSPSKK